MKKKDNWSKGKNGGKEQIEKQNKNRAKKD